VPTTAAKELSSPPGRVLRLKLIACRKAVVPLRKLVQVNLLLLQIDVLNVLDRMAEKALA